MQVFVVITSIILVRGTSSIYAAAHMGVLLVLLTPRRFTLYQLLPLDLASGQLVH